MKHSQTDERRTACAEKARDWCRSKLVESDLDALEDKLWSTRGLGDPEEDEDNWDARYCDGGGILAVADAFILIREAANHYPFPMTEPLLDAAIRELQTHVGNYSVNGVLTEGVEYSVVEGIIKKLLEEPDALLG